MAGKKYRESCVLSYDIAVSSSLNTTFWCDTHEQMTAFLSCPMCDSYPCRQMTMEHQRALLTSPLMDKKVTGLSAPRRMKVMYIAKMHDGSLKALDNLDPNNPDVKMLSGVEEVYQIGKVLVPTVVLKPKPKQERDEVIRRESKKEATEPENKLPTKRKKRRTKVNEGK